MTAPTTGDPLMDTLRELLSQLDPMPAQLLDRARQALCWRTVDAELAELSFDSLVDHRCALAVRAGADTAAEPRSLSFGAVVDGEDLAIEVEVSETAGRSMLVGQVWPPGARTVELQTGSGAATSVAADDVGRFVVEPVPSGPVRLCITHNGRTVQTTWVSCAVS